MLACVTYTGDRHVALLGALGGPVCPSIHSSIHPRALARAPPLPPPGSPRTPPPGREDESVVRKWGGGEVEKEKKEESKRSHSLLFLLPLLSNSLSYPSSSVAVESPSREERLFFGGPGIGHPTSAHFFCHHLKKEGR